MTIAKDQAIEEGDTAWLKRVCEVEEIIDTGSARSGGNYDKEIRAREPTNRFSYFYTQRVFDLLQHTFYSLGHRSEMTPTRSGFYPE
jgi:hypothetical protein